MLFTSDLAALFSVLAAAGGLSPSVLVAIGALVVVLALFLCFVMVLRSHGDAKKTAGGLGFDAHQGPLGQPQAPASQPDFAHQRQAPGWGQDPQFSAGMPPSGQMSWGNQGMASNRAPAPDVAANGTGWGAASAGQNPQQQGWWNEPAAPVAQATPAAWNDPAATRAPSWDNAKPEPAAPWGEPDPWGQQRNGAPAPNAGRNAGQPGWDMPAPANNGGWGDAPAAGGGGDVWGQPTPSSAPAWGTPAAPSGQHWGAPNNPAATPAWGAPPVATPSAPAGAGFGGGMSGMSGMMGGGLADEERTRMVRPASPQRIGTLVVRQGKEPGRTFEVRKERMTIGRSRESDIFLEDLAVSRLHTIVGRDDQGHYVLHDENSANGTYVNGQRVSDHVLEEGDEIQVGQTVLRFVQR